MSKGEPLSLCELHGALLSMLVRFDRFCRAHELAYSVWAGTLLGAIRHQGFIPWDDDADLGMARPDYNRLVGMADAFYEETGLRIVGHLGIPLEISPILKIVDESIIVKPKTEAAESFLWLDVNSVDAMPESREELEALCKHTSFCQRALNFLGSTPESGATPVRRAVKRLATPLRYSKRLRCHYGRKLQRLASALPYGSTPFVGVVAWGLGGTTERIHRDAFEQRMDVPFEGEMLSAIGNADEYLRGIYGLSYMEYPPKQFQVSHLAGAWHVKGAS